MTTTTTQSKPSSLSQSHLPVLLAAASVLVLAACGGPLDELPGEETGEVQVSPVADVQPQPRLLASPHSMLPIGPQAAMSELAASVSTLAFPPTSMGNERREMVQLTNVGLAPVYLDGDGLSIVTENGTAIAEFTAVAEAGYDADAGLAPGQRLSIEVTFMPATVGPKAARLEVRAVDGALVTVDLAGNATHPGRCGWTISAGQLDFGELAMFESRTLVLEIRNDEAPGGVVCSATPRIAPASNHRFVLAYDPTTATLQPGDTMQVEITFNAKDEVGDYSAWLVVEMQDGTPGEAFIELNAHVVN